MAAAREKPDMIVIDVLLGNGSGVRAMARIGRTGAVPHVFISGGILPRGIEALLKPFRETELLDAIDRARSARAATPSMRQ